MTRDELLALPAVIGLDTACRVLGIGRPRAAKMIAAGAFPSAARPCRVLRLGTEYRIPTVGDLRLLAALGVTEDGGEADRRRRRLACWQTGGRRGVGSQVQDLPRRRLSVLAAVNRPGASSLSLRMLRTAGGGVSDGVMSRRELLDLPAVIDLATACRALGIGRNRAARMIADGEFPDPDHPCRVLRMGREYRIPTAGSDGFFAALGIDPDEEPRRPGPDRALRADPARRWPG